MDSDAGADDDERVIELSSIAAIFPELVLDPAEPFDALLDIQVTPVAPLKIRFAAAPADGALPHTHPPPAPTVSENSAHHQKADEPAETTKLPEQDDIHTLTYLPPISLRISLPEGYPAENAPKFEISISTPWLPLKKIESLVDDGPRLWEELGHDQVVYTYIDHIQQAAENAFGLAENGDHMWSVSRDLKIALLDFDIQTKREKFEKETFDCGICLEPKKGSACHRMLTCSHVFCVQCLQECYIHSIVEGDVDSIKCLEPACGTERQIRAVGAKKRRRKDPTLNPSELLQIPIEQDKVQRYVRLKRKKRLESDKSTVYCPRQWCQGAARSKKHPKPLDPISDEIGSASDSEEETVITQTNKKQSKSEEDYPPMSERLCICEDCAYAFCSVCKKGWHGELSVCNPRKKVELDAEEKASEEYLKLHTTQCPTCSAPSQKTMGCNHMICHICKTHFCYLCSSWLDASNPYSHFNNHKSTCYMRLWELEAGDGDQIDHRFNGRHDDWADEESDDESVNLEPIADFEDIVDFDDGTDSEDDVWIPGPELQRDMNNQRNNRNNRNNRDARQRRPRGADQPPEIQIINFEHQGGQNPRNLAAHGAVGEPPPPAPAPLRRNRPGPPNAPANFHPILPIRAAPPPRAIPAEQHLGHEIQAEMINNQQRAERPAAAPGQRNDAAQQPAPVRAMGLERFLELARLNREEEWDSDELDEELGDVRW